MESLRPIDLRFGGKPYTIGVYVIETDDGPALFDTGPRSTLRALEAGLAERGMSLAQIRHVLLSHVHLDHAGAAGTLARAHPHLTIWASEIAARHLVDPSRLERSARRVYGDAFDALWGELVPVPDASLRVAVGDVLGWETFPTVGHASHHVSYARDGTVLAGDAAGVRLPESAYVVPAAPPPDIDIEAWHATVDAIRARQPERLALIHFGVHSDVGTHLSRLERELDIWAARVRDGLDEAAFVAASRNDLGARADDYETVAQFRASWEGLRRYWDHRLATGRKTI